MGRGVSFARPRRGEAMDNFRQTATENAPASRRGRRPSGRRGSLIDWRDPDKNAHVLDWRRRAHEFGLMPVSSEEEDDAPTVVEAPERLLHDEEPEAFEDQHFEDGDQEELTEEEIEAPPQAG